MRKYQNHPFVILGIFLQIIVLINGKKQTEALSNLYKAKYSGKSSIDRSHFKVVKHVSIPEISRYNKDGSKAKDRIESLPGQPQVNFEQYGGYITVDKSAGRALYYYFTEAQHSPTKSPLLLWLNGGPGCSSMAFGAMQELGPFRVYSDGKTLYKNRFSWNYAANVLFLESPAGVGFSYSNTTDDYVKTGDKSTAEDNYVFLVNWLERFGEYKTRELYIAGESYAGHYVPQLAHTILQHYHKANNTIINLKGILIGNAVLNDETDITGMFDYFATHALASPEVVQKAKRFCDFSPNATTDPSDECNTVYDEISNDIKNIDVYNIYAPQCFSHNTTSKPKKASVRNFDPCSGNYVHAYLNRREVQNAMHANVTKLKHDWEPCSDIIKNWTDSPSTVLPLLKDFLSNGLRVWIFSGDIDGRVPVTSTQYSINQLKLNTKIEWHPWFINLEVGGYVQVYEGNLTFITVRGAGHQVPSYQPLRALSLVKHFLAGTPLPSTTTSTF